MNKLNVDSICCGLQSSKVKDRGDAIDLLNQVQSNFDFYNTKDIVRILDSSFRLIEHEKALYLKSASNSVENRIYNITHTVKQLITLSLESNLKIYYDGGSKKIPDLKYKHYFRVIEEIKTIITVADNSLFCPCAQSMLSVLNALLDSTFFKDHQGFHDWRYTYNFVLHCIKLSLLNDQTCLVQSYRALSLLLNAENSISLVFLPFLQDKCYHRVLPLLLQTINGVSKESTLVVTIFKIINKLIIEIITQDRNFAYKLVILGFKLSIQFIDTRMSELLEQITIFLNLSETHCLVKYAQSDEFTSMQPINKSIDSEDEIQDVEQNEMGDLITRKPSIASVDEESKYLNYNIRALIRSLFGIVANARFYINFQNIAFISDITPQTASFYRLNSINLLPKCTDQERTNWLLLRGLMELINTFLTTFKSNAISSSGTPEPQVKRPKLDLVVQGLYSTQSVIMFCDYILSNKESSEDELRATLQIVTFYYQLHLNKETTPIPEPQLSLLLFDLPLQSDDFLSKIIKCTEVSKLTSWSLLAIKSFLDVNETSFETLSQVLTLSLSFISNRELCSCSCINISQILSTSSDDILHRLANSVIVHNLSAILKQIEVKGPSTFSYGTFSFWFAIQKFSRNGNISLGVDLQTVAIKWLYQKWHPYFNNHQNLELDQEFLFQLCVFVMWVIGVDINQLAKISLSPIVQSNDEYMVLSNQYQKQSSFLLRDYENFTHKRASCYLDTFVYKEELTSDFFEQLMIFSYNIKSLTSNHSYLISWSIFISKISCSISELSKITSNNLINQAISILDELVEESEKIDFKSTFCGLLVVEDQNFQKYYYLNVLIKSGLKHLGQPQYYNSSSKLLTKKTILETPDNRDPFGDFKISSFKKTTFHSYIMSKIVDNDPVIKYLYNLGTILDHDENSLLILPELLGILFNYIETNRDKIIYLFSNLFDYINSNPLNEKILKLFSRKFGTLILSNHITERNEICIIIASKFLILTKNITNEEFRKDWEDILEWLIMCSQKQLINTLESKTAYLKLLIDIQQMDSNVSLLPQISNRRYSDLFLSEFKSASSFSRIAICSNINCLFKRFTTSRQLLMYNEILKCFQTPQESIDSFVTFTLFLTALAKETTSLVVPVVFNLIEYSSFTQFSSFLQYSLNELSNRFLFTSINSFFKSIKLNIFKLWYTYHSTYDNFPFDLFEFKDLKQFFAAYCAELTAIILSSTKSVQDAVSIIEKLVSGIEGLDVESVVTEGFCLAIVFAYAKNGIKNQIHGNLKAILSEKYSLLVRKKVLFIALNIFRFIDVNSIKLDIEEHDLQSDNRSIEFLSISSSSGIELLKLVVAKKYSCFEDFWTEPTVYFICRQLCLDFNFKNDDLSCIERLELVIKYNKNFPSSLSIARILVSALSPYLSNPDLCGRIQKLWNEFDWYKISKDDSTESLQLIIQILSCIQSTSIHTKTTLDMKFLNQIENSLLNFNRAPSISTILSALISKLKGESSSVSINCIESSIAEFCKSKELNSISVHDNLVSIISSIFPKIDSEQEKFMDVSKFFDQKINLNFETNPILKFILDTDKSYLQEMNQFVQWCCNYISGYYMKGMSVDNVFKSSHTYLEEMSFKTTGVKMFDSIFDQALATLNSSSLQIRTYVESIIGVLLWKYNTNKTELLKSLSFEEHFDYFSKFIVPIDFDDCIQLFTMNGIKQLYSQSLTQAIEDPNSENYPRRLFLALSTEMSRFSSLSSLFSLLCVESLDFCNSALPYVIYNYAKLIGKNGATTVLQILDGFKYHDKPLSELYLKMLLIIRVGAREGNNEMREIYSKADLNFFTKLAIDLKLPRTALILFEDSIQRDDSACVLNSNRATILREIYSSMENDDLLDGLPLETNLNSAIAAINKSNSTKLTPLMLNSSQYDANIILTDDTKHITNIDSRLAYSIKNAGLLGASRTFTSELNFASTEHYESSWKLNCWDLPIPRTFDDENKVIYSLLKELKDNYANSQVFDNSLTKLLQDKELMVCENGNIFKFQRKMQSWIRCVAVVNSISNLNGELESLENSDLKDITSNTNWFREVESDMSENILLSREIFLQNIASNLDFKSINKDHLWLKFLFEANRFFSISRDLKQQQKMMNSAVLINKVIEERISDKDLQQQLIKFSKFHSAISLWDLGETNMAIAMMQNIKYNDIILPIKSLSISKNLVNSILVEWLANSRQELPSNILKNYVLPIYNQLESFENIEDNSIICQKLAQFCEKRHHSIDESITKLKKPIRSRLKEIEEIKVHYTSSNITPDEKKNIQRYYSKLKTQHQTEISELEALENEKDRLASYSVEFYLKSILTDSMDGENLDKFFALWLEFSNKSNLNIKIRDALLSLPAHLMLGWGPQLISRLMDDKTEFQTSLHLLIKKLCIKHPYHSLYNLYSLTKQENSKKLNPTSTIAALKLWNELKNTESVNSKIVSVENFCEHSIKLAEYKSVKGKVINLDRLRVGSWFLESLPKIPPPTLQLPVDCTSNYTNLATFDYLEAKIDIATSGLSLPKIATFHLSDGTKHKVLFKHGSDDLRQDSIMEQVFEKVNIMFKKNFETRKRKLSIRTYKAVPLGPSDGLIEFVPDSIAFIDIIRPYHSLNDSLKPEKAREMMKNCQTKSKEQRRKVYQQITEKITPVLCQFFLDTYLKVEDWYRSRILYTNGVASSSIVGYMLGLGDRHCNNILLDKKTGEPIHIDLGVAFDQGKLLPIPETVPFRLTRDIVDGFGVTGTSGVFTKSCEHTFRLLRLNKPHILAILDVLRWDPLYSWTISPVRKNKLQHEEGAVLVNIPDEGSEATRAIRKVEDKLGGVLSVEATVSELIHEATDEDNLALIYCGWCPFF